MIRIKVELWRPWEPEAEKGHFDQVGGTWHCYLDGSIAEDAYDQLTSMAEPEFLADLVEEARDPEAESPEIPEDFDQQAYDRETTQQMGLPTGEALDETQAEILRDLDKHQPGEEGE